MKIFLPLFVLIFTLACTRTTPAGPQTNPTPATSVTKQAKSNDFGNAIFKGSGNEPFWSLQLDENHTLLLKSIDDHQFNIKTPITDINRVNDANALRLTAATADQKITIMLLENNCQDDMSGKKSSHGIQVVIKEISNKNTVLYKGCGAFQNEYLINNKWELESINDRKVAELPIEKTPTLNIDLLNKKMSGFAGCNTIFGDVQMTDGKLTFGTVGMTKKLCKDNTLETSFVRLLNYKNIKHTITKDGKLILRDLEQAFTYRPIK